MNEFWWFIHILGSSLWLGTTTAVLLAWPYKHPLTKTSHQVSDIRTLIGLMNRGSHTGAGLAALGGTVLSFYVHPKSELAAFWLVTMQGLGVIAFVLSVIVSTRLGKRLIQSLSTDAAIGDHALYHRYLRLLIWTFVLLFICLIMAAFKPVLWR